jgi:hypothetical protein
MWKGKDERKRNQFSESTKIDFSERRYTQKHEKVKKMNSLPSRKSRFKEIYPLCLGSSETVSFLRPLARRAFSTLRPFAVDILSRKPCLFLLFLLDG